MIFLPWFIPTYKEPEKPTQVEIINQQQAKGATFKEMQESYRSFGDKCECGGVTLQVIANALPKCIRCGKEPNKKTETP